MPIVGLGKSYGAQPRLSNTVGEGIYFEIYQDLFSK